MFFLSKNFQCIVLLFYVIQVEEEQVRDFNLIELNLK
jgi:hypothetical protein